VAGKREQSCLVCEYLHLSILWACSTLAILQSLTSLVTKYPILPKVYRSWGDDGLQGQLPVQWTCLDESPSHINSGNGTTSFEILEAETKAIDSSNGSSTVNDSTLFLFSLLKLIALMD
jgi:hypothetical protein